MDTQEKYRITRKMFFKITQLEYLNVLYGIFHQNNEQVAIHFITQWLNKFYPKKVSILSHSPLNVDYIIWVKRWIMIIENNQTKLRLGFMPLFFFQS